MQIKNGSLLDYCKVPEEVMDEQVKNGASLLHFYAALINVSSLWRAETLYFVFEIVSEKSMDFSEFMCKMQSKCDVRLFSIIMSC